MKVGSGTGLGQSLCFLGGWSLLNTAIKLHASHRGGNRKELCPTLAGTSGTG